MVEKFEWRLREQAQAEIVMLRCPACGHLFRFVGRYPLDRDEEVFCPANCSRDGYTSKYGRWIVREVALIFPDRIVFLREKDAAGFKIETI